jgi:hypothetical protein
MIHKNMALLFVLSSLASVQVTPALACSVAPTLDEETRDLREDLNSADMLFIGQVQRITKRRWTADDQLGLYEQRLLESQAEGRELADAEERVLVFSDAEARLQIDTSMKPDGLDAPPYYFGASEIDVDLLRPVRSRGDGLCSAHPRPCPWDIEAGDWVAIALRDQPFQKPLTIYCVTISGSDLGARNRIEARRGSVEPAELFWPFLEESYGDWPFGETPYLPRANSTPSGKPRPNPAFNN